MKTFISFIFLAAAPVALAQSGSLSVTNLEDFHDFSVSGMSEERTLPLFQEEMGRKIEELSKKYLPENSKIELVFSNVDMAGDIQPWRNRNFADIRYIEEIYPPRLVFTFKVINSKGTVITEGEADIRNLAFTMTALPFRGAYDSFYYEAELLERWFRNELRDQLKTS